jgi:hypothetical protein
MRLPIRLIDEGQAEQLTLTLSPRVEVKPKRREPVQLSLDFSGYPRFRRIQSERFANAGQELRPYDTPISRILADNSVRDLQEAEDRLALDAINQAMTRAGEQFIGQPATPVTLEAMSAAATALLRETLNRPSFRLTVPPTGIFETSTVITPADTSTAGTFTATGTLSNPVVVNQGDTLNVTLTFTYDTPTNFVGYNHVISDNEQYLRNMYNPVYVDDGDIRDQEELEDKGVVPEPTSIMQRAQPNWSYED